jgi:hypothetical protein
VTALDQEAADLARLVGGDASGHAKQHPGHPRMMPTRSAGNG